MEEDQCVEILVIIELHHIIQVAVIFSVYLNLTLTFYNSLNLFLNIVFYWLLGGGGNFHQNSRGRY